MTDPFRLPAHVRPRRYDLLVRPDLDAATSGGTVRIELEVAEATDRVVLHARDLDVRLAGVASAGAEIAAELATDPADERLTITLAHPLEAGPATLDLEFTGPISPGMLGFYLSRFTDEAGNAHVLGATQFEAPHARAAFPCFDEPEFKAVFGITLDVADGLLALSNGPEIGRESAEPGRVQVRFGDTIPMSTYLVAWVVGPLELTPPVDAGGVPMRIAHVPGKGHLTGFALEVGAFALQFFADYYGIPYPGEKCDMVALPDFSFGAMENLGLITYRETRLLVDPDEVTLDEMTAAALTIVHEVAHMWFGDLVTMKWWNGIWLNEAFATFMERLGVDTHRPEWRTWDDFAVGRAAALDVDALPSTRTVEYEVHTPEDADGMFDTLTYQKGGSVLRMLERWLGAERFRDGVRMYLDRYKLGNTETTDLWDALEDATGQPVRRIMDSWIFQPGFPILEPAADGRVEQERFTYTGAGGDEVYAVPLLTRLHTNGVPQTNSVLLGSEAGHFDAPADALVVLNAGGEGFYRVAYPPEWRARLLEAGVLEPLERFALVDDLWAAVLANRTSAVDYLSTAQHFAGERELVVWRVLTGGLRAVGRLVDGAALDRYRAIVAEIAGPTMARLGWESRAGEDARTRQLRGLTVSLLGGFVGDPEVVARAREIVERPEASDADLSAACITVVAGAGSADDFADYEDRARRSKNPQEQLRFQYALGDFPAEALVLRASELALTDFVRPQNTPFVLQRALRNRDHGPAAWAFVRDHWDELRGRLGSGALVARALEGTTWLVDDASAADIPAFLREHPIPDAARVVAQHVDRLTVHRATREREQPRLEEHLS
jgi:puromycin-sensitive aminopeptidase